MKDRRHDQATLANPGDTELIDMDIGNFAGLASGFVRQNRPQLFVASDRMAVSAILMFTSSDRTRGHGLLRAIDTGRLVFQVLAASGAECGAPGGVGPHAVRHHGAGGRRGTSRGRVGPGQGGARPDRPLGAPASTPRRRRRAGASPAPGRLSAGSSTWTASRSRSWCCGSWPGPARSRSLPAQAAARYKLDRPGRPTPARTTAPLTDEVTEVSDPAGDERALWKGTRQAPARACCASRQVDKGAHSHQRARMQRASRDTGAVELATYHP
jgi:hypothetical protein